MNELIKALTELCQAATRALDAGTRKTGAETPAEPAKERKARAPKAEKEESAAKPEKTLTEEESLKEIMVVVTNYVQRFSQRKPTDGATEARARLKDKYGVDALAKLSHDQRLEFIAWANGELAKPAV